MGNPEQVQGSVGFGRIADKLDIRIRDFRQTDLNYVSDSWHKSARAGLPWVPMHIYLPEMQSRITRLLARSKTTVACDTVDPDFIIGWSCIENDALHYVFVRRAFQRAGVASRLAGGLPRPIVFSHWTPEWASYIGNRACGFNPLLVGDDMRSVGKK